MADERMTETNTGTGPGPAGGLVGISETFGIAVASVGGGENPGVLPSGGITLDVGADVTSQLNQAIPAFGNVIAAIGNGVATSQQALDKSVVDTVNKLNTTNITVVTQVVEVLNDDGLPDGSKTQLVTQNVSVLNYFSPIVHEWKNVAIAMDLEVGSFHADQGLQFSRTQEVQTVSAVGLFWGFVGWFDTEDKTTTSSLTVSNTQEVAWQQGQVRVDALLGPRNTSRFPTPDSVTIGPQIYISQGAVIEQKAGQVVTARTLNVVIEVRKASGIANPGVNLVVDAGGLLPSFIGGTSTTDANGVVRMTLTRNLTAGFTGFQKFTVTVSLGDLQKTFNVTL